MDKFTKEEWHRKQAIQNFNKTWNLIAKKDDREYFISELNSIKLRSKA